MSEETPAPRPPDPSWPPPQPAYPAPAYYQPPAYQAYRPPPALPTFPHAAPTPYHQMLRTWTYAAWKPVVGIVVGLLGMLIVMPLVLLPVLALGVLIEGGPFLETFEKAATLQTVDPAALLYLNLVLGSMILVTWFSIRVIHRMRPRWLASVRPRLRWRFLFVCLGLAVVALVAQLAVGAVLPGQNETDTGPLNDFTTTTAAIAVIVLLTTPFQAAGEEYLFRGYLLMAVGSLFANRTVGKWVAIVVTATLFALAHGGQNFPLFFDRFMFGLIAGWLVIRTGGLEAGIALHILNNFLAYGFALAFGDLTETLTVSQVSWWNIPLTLTQSGLYALLVAWVAHRMNVETTTSPPQDALAQEPVVATV
jgi:membrane protease YdiL (CAAX protease family)